MQRHLLKLCGRLPQQQFPKVLPAQAQWTSIPASFQCHRYASSSSPYEFMTVKTDEKTGIATLTMTKKRVNGFSLEFLTEFRIALEKLETDKRTKGVIITSGIPNVFSAGLDLTELYNPKKERLETFWRAFQDAAMQLYGTSLAVVAAINGACPAGAMAFAMASDYRVQAAGKHLTGLLEAQMGLPPPFWLKDMMLQLIGFRRTDMAVQRGQTFTPEEALQMGLVDKVVPVEEVMSTALAEMEKLLAVPDLGRKLSKTVVRRPFVEEFRQRRDDDMRVMTSAISSEPTQIVMRNYIDAMKKRPK